jgi:hypothetical protein
VVNPQIVVRSHNGQWWQSTIPGDSACQTAAPCVKVAICNGAKPPKFSVVTGQTCAGDYRTIRTVDPTPVVLASLWSRPKRHVHGRHAAGPVIPNSDFVHATPEP